jgi:hypothetical protein
MKFYFTECKAEHSLKNVMKIFFHLRLTKCCEQYFLFMFWITFCKKLKFCLTFLKKDFLATFWKISWKIIFTYVLKNIEKNIFHLSSALCSVKKIVTYVLKKDFSPTFWKMSWKIIFTYVLKNVVKNIL